MSYINFRSESGGRLRDCGKAKIRFVSFISFDGPGSSGSVQKRAHTFQEQIGHRRAVRWSGLSRAWSPAVAWVAVLTRRSFREQRFCAIGANAMGEIRLGAVRSFRCNPRTNHRRPHPLRSERPLEPQTRTAKNQHEENCQDSDSDEIRPRPIRCLHGSRVAQPRCLGVVGRRARPQSRAARLRDIGLNQSQNSAGQEDHQGHYDH